ncbi:MAG: type IV pilus biogenesis protein [marine bacterium B5-7]|nr:MAG: type IV pilus biogenesis protein [marine bacterium B5-7]
MKKNNSHQFIQQLSALLDANVSLIQALWILHQEAATFSRTAIMKTLSSLHAGRAFYQAIKDFSVTDEVIQCVSVGEKTGRLAENLRALSLLLKEKEAFKQQVIQASIYPLFLLGSATCVLFMMLWAVVPKFASLYGDKQAIPAITHAIFRLSQMMHQHVYLIIVTSVLSMLFIVMQWRFLLGKSPLLHRVASNFSVANASRTMTYYLNAKLPVYNAISHLVEKPGLHQPIWRQCLNDLAQGCSLHDSLNKSNALPQLFLAMIHLGESSGTLTERFQYCAAHYHTLAIQQWQRCLRLLEPSVLIVLGLIIGFIVTALYMPLFSLGEYV